MKRRSKALTLTAVALGLGLTGCSSGAPDFGDIEASMWESMESSQAMRVTAALPEALAQESEMIEDVLGGDISDVMIYGSMDETATAISLGEDQEPLIMFFDDDVYVSMDATLQMMSSSEIGQLSPQEMDILSALSDQLEGKYVEISDDYSSEDIISMKGLVADMREATPNGDDSGVTPFSFDDISPEGDLRKLSANGDETGWFYATNDGYAESDTKVVEADQYVAVHSDKDQPRIAKIHSEGSTIDFAYDDDVTIPERPSGDTLLTEEDFQQMIFSEMF